MVKPQRVISVTVAEARAFTLYIAMKIRGRSLAVCLGLVCLSAAHGQQYTIQTLTGNGSAGFVGDSGDPAAVTVELSTAPWRWIPRATSTLPIPAISGFVRFPFPAARSRRSPAPGTIGQSGDGAAATAATLNSPSGLAFDSKDNLYIADTGNNVIRKITGTTITTVAGQFGQGVRYGGDGGRGNFRESQRPDGCRSGRARQPLHRGHGKQPGSARWMPVRALSRPYIGGTGGTLGTSGKLSAPNGLWFDAQRRTVYRGFQQRARSTIRPSRPPSVNFAGNRSSGLQGRWRPSDRRAIEQAGWYHDGRRRKHLRRRCEQQPDPQDSGGRHDHHHRRQGRSRLQRRRRKRHRGGAELSRAASRSIPTARSTSPTRAIT